MENKSSSAEALEKAPTGIPGLDELTFGGLPRRRTGAVVVFDKGYIDYGWMNELNEA